MLDPHFQAMLAAQAEAAPAQAPPLSQIPPGFLRQMYREQRTSQNTASSPADVATRDLPVDGAAGPIPARLYTPAESPGAGPLLVYFHGGGWVIGDLETHDGHCRRLAAFSGAQVLAVDYRLAPEHPFPAGHDDALAATRWAFAHAGDLGVDPMRIGVGGDSAGGNLAASVAQDLKDDPKLRLKFQLLLYPATGPAEPTQSRTERDGPVLSSEAMLFFEACLNALTHPHGRRASPAQAVDLRGLPAALVVTAGHDPLEHEGRDYAAALQKAGVEARWVNYPTLVHDFFIMGDVSPAVVEAARETAQALREAL